MIGAKNVKGGFALLSLGLVGGLAMSLYAFDPLVQPPASMVRYDDLPRRLIRLAHISAVMLPLLNIVMGPWVDRVALSRPAKELASLLLLAGAALLPAALFLEALWPPAGSWHVAGPPVVAFCLGTLQVSFGALRTTFKEDFR
jgi:hypothetical protein